MKIKQLNSQETFLSIHLIYNINKADVPYRHKYEIFSEKVIIFHEFSLIIKKKCLKPGMYVHFYIVFRGQ